jgi:hypothetical protein
MQETLYCRPRLVSTSGDMGGRSYNRTGNGAYFSDAPSALPRRSGSDRASARSVGLYPRNGTLPRSQNTATARAPLLPLSNHRLLRAALAASHFQVIVVSLQDSPFKDFFL